MKKRLVKKGQLGFSVPVFTGENAMGTFSMLPNLTTSKNPAFSLNSLNNSLQNFQQSGVVQSAMKASDSAKGLTGLFGSAGGLTKANNFLSKGIGGSGISAGGLATSALSIADKFIPQAEDKASKITSGVFNGLSKVAGFIPGIGTVASVALKGLGTLFGAGVKGVEGNAKMDTVDSSSSYTGADALDSKRFGIAGLGSAKKYQKQVDERERQRRTAYNIINTGKDDLLASSNVQQLQLADNLQKNASDWMYNIRAGEFGMKIKNAKRLAKKYQEGKKIVTSEPMKAGTTETPQFLAKGDIVKKRGINQLIAYAKQVNPRFIQRLSEAPRGIKFIDDEGKLAEGSHYLTSAGKYVIPRIQEVNGILQFFSPQEAIDRALETGNYLEMDPDEAIDFAENYKQGWPNFFQKFQNGGSINVIPEGALHARKHNLEELNPELEGNITKKGIPVISQNEGGEITQQAEIERSEIIFRIEATQAIEELRKKYHSAESEAEKDQIAIEAGKLVAHEIMENTIDNTGELLG